MLKLAYSIQNVSLFTTILPKLRTADSPGWSSLVSSLFMHFLLTWKNSANFVFILASHKGKTLTDCGVMSIV